MSLAEHLANAAGVAYSRLWRLNLLEDLRSLSVPLIEVPHVRGIPVPLHVPDGFVRIVEWPNLAGILEPSTGDAVIRWDPLLAPLPQQSPSVTVSELRQPPDIARRTAHLRSLTSRLGQLPDVIAPIRPDTPTAIILTRGVRDGSLDSVNKRFPGSIQHLRSELAEFPGGLQLVVTDEVWALPEEYAESVEQALQRERFA